MGVCGLLACSPFPLSPWLCGKGVLPGWGRLGKTRGLTDSRWLTWLGAEHGKPISRVIVKNNSNLIMNKHGRTTLQLSWGCNTDWDNEQIGRTARNLLGRYRGGFHIPLVAQKLHVCTKVYTHRRVWALGIYFSPDWVKELAHRESKSISGKETY